MIRSTPLESIEGNNSVLGVLGALGGEILFKFSGGNVLGVLS